MTNLNECQIPCLPQFAEGYVEGDALSLTRRLKRALAKPWNYHVKGWIKKLYYFAMKVSTTFKPASNASVAVEVRPGLVAGDLVRVRSREEIEATLNPWKELKGCAFLEDMWQYCGSTRRVLKSMERFLDERDYRVKKVRGIVLLENVICGGTPVFGRCDRCCFLFWREEWLEKIN
jgi:hypothetical protein